MKEHQQMKYLMMAIFFPLITQAEGNTKKIPFVYESVTIVDVSNLGVGQKAQFPGEIEIMGQKGEKGKAAKKTTQSEEVEATKVAELVKSIRDSICDGIGKGNFRVWLKFDASKKILGIGTSAEGGVEVSVNCG